MNPHLLAYLAKEAADGRWSFGVEIVTDLPLVPASAEQRIAPRDLVADAAEMAANDCGLVVRRIVAAPHPRGRG